MFDPNIYAQLAAASPEAAAQYLATFSAPAAPVAAPAPAAAPPVAAFAPAPPSQNIQQGFAQQAAAPQQVAARGTLEDFFGQQTGSGPSVTSKFFKDRPVGSWLQLQVLADVTHADVQHQKTPQGVLQYFKKNGQDDLTRPKLVLVVKVQVLGSSDGSHTLIFPDGQASLWLKKGPVSDDLVRAMTAAGDPSGYPKGGSVIVMESAGEQASRTVGYSATKLYRFQYAMPAGSVDPTSPVPSVPQAAPIPPVSTSPAASAPAPIPTPATTPAPSLTTPAAPAAVPTEVPAANFTPPPAAPAAAAPTDQAAALLASLQGQS